MRDRNKNTEYFNSFIGRQERTINHFTESIIIGRAKIERHPQLKLAILSAHIEKTIALYSMGEAKSSIRMALVDSIAAFEEGFKWQGKELGYGQYEEMLWLVCLGLLCDIPADDFKRITNIIKRDGVKDKLLDFIIHGKLGNEWPVTAHNYIEPSLYKNTDNLSSAIELKHYLDKVWYKGQKDAEWHDSHLDTEVNTYFGYWAWEAAAIVKLKGVDDSSLKEQKYYPYDAVHW